jgi:hypothetical protein
MPSTSEATAGPLTGAGWLYGRYPCPQAWYGYGPGAPYGPCGNRPCGKGPWGSCGGTGGGGMDTGTVLLVRAAAQRGLRGACGDVRAGHGPADGLAAW